MTKRHTTLDWHPTHLPDDPRHVRLGDLSGSRTERCYHPASLQGVLHSPVKRRKEKRCSRVVPSRTEIMRISSGCAVEVMITTWPGNRPSVIQRGSPSSTRSSSQVERRPHKDRCGIGNVQLMLAEMDLPFGLIPGESRSGNIHIFMQIRYIGPYGIGTPGGVGAAPRGRPEAGNHRGVPLPMH